MPLYLALAGIGSLITENGITAGDPNCNDRNTPDNALLALIGAVDLLIC